jgi:ribosomal 50S subunit-recycling heat shock protein
MRVDLFLKHVCLAKSRSRAQALCNGGSILINARPARPSAEVHEGDRLELALPGRRLIIEIDQVPARQLSKSTAPEAYRILLDERVAGEDL